MTVPRLSNPHFEKFKGLVHGYTTRIGGVSEPPYDSLNLGWSTGEDDDVILENYRILAKSIGTTSEQIVGVHQVHGTEVHVADPRHGRHEMMSVEADAIISRAENLFLSVRVADCFPILLVDPSMRSLGVVHAGWRGTLEDILANTIRKMNQTFMSPTEKLWIGIGPGIQKCCFEVAHGVYALFAQEGDLKDDEAEERGEKVHLNLAAILRRTAREAGVPDVQIWSSGLCTKCDSEKFYSYRRDGKNAGRMVGFIGWSPT